MKILQNAILIILITATTLSAQVMDHKKEHKEMQPDQETLVQVLDDFQTAIINNNQQKASALLTEDARILESGGMETKKEYLSHHFHSDGKFLSAIKRETTSQHVQGKENTAWVSTISTMTGTYNKRKIDMESAELAVLVKTETGWKIAALHWSSRSSK